MVAISREHAREMGPDRNLDVYAARQYGVFSLSQARSAGLTPSMIETRIASGAWVRMAPSVYSMSSAPPKWERQVAAALLTRPGSMVAGAASAHLHDFDGFGPCRPVIMIGAKGNGRSALARVIRVKAFTEIRRVRIRGFETEDPAETLVTLSADTATGTLERLVDEGLVSSRFTAGEIDDAIRRRGASPGVTKLRRIVAPMREDAYVPPSSELERLLFSVLADPRLPATTRQMPFWFPSVSMTVDVFIPEWGLIIEADGRRWHTRRADFERDRQRDNEATAHGYSVLRFTYHMLRDEPRLCLDTILRTGQIRANRRSRAI